MGEEMEKKLVDRAIRVEEAIADLMDAEKIVAQLKKVTFLQAFTGEQCTHYYAALLLLRELPSDLSENNSREQLAS